MLALSGGDTGVIGGGGKPGDISSGGGGGGGGLFKAEGGSGMASGFGGFTSGRFIATAGFDSEDRVDWE